jgi:hypothetical protein
MKDCMKAGDDNEKEHGTVVEASHFFDARESGFSGANEDALQVRLTLLLQEHSDLDSAIVALGASPGFDPLALARLKKKKLQLKDVIKKLRDQMTPDIIA